MSLSTITTFATTKNTNTVYNTTLSTDTVYNTTLATITTFNTTQSTTTIFNTITTYDTATTLATATSKATTTTFETTKNTNTVYNTTTTTTTTASTVSTAAGFQEINLANPSFELPDTGASTFLTVVNSWFIFTQTAGVFKVSAGSYTLPAPGLDGDQVLFLTSGALVRQDTSYAFAPLDTLQIDVAVGWRSDIALAGEPCVSLVVVSTLQSLAEYCISAGSQQQGGVVQCVVVGAPHGVAAGQGMRQGQGRVEVLHGDLTGAVRPHHAPQQRHLRKLIAELPPQPGPQPRARAARQRAEAQHAAQRVALFRLQRERGVLSPGGQAAKKRGGQYNSRFLCLF